MSSGKDIRRSGCPDIVLSPDECGEFHLLSAATDRGRSWIHVNIPRPAWTREQELVIGPMHVPDLVACMRHDGLHVSWSEAAS